MKTRMPFGGFFLKLLDEQNGTCEYEEYQRKCEEEPLTEEEQKEQAEQAKAVNKELERLNAESEQNKPEVVPKQQLELIPAETMRWSYASEMIGDEFQHWGTEGLYWIWERAVARASLLSGRWLAGQWNRCCMGTTAIAFCTSAR